VYPIRVSSINASVSAAIFCLAAMSFERTFAEFKISIALSSSRMFPLLFERTPRILSSSL
jgi:hypothetical protein